MTSKYQPTIRQLATACEYEASQREFDANILTRAAQHLTKAANALDCLTENEKDTGKRN